MKDLCNQFIELKRKTKRVCLPRTSFAITFCACFFYFSFHFFRSLLLFRLEIKLDNVFTPFLRSRFFSPRLFVHFFSYRVSQEKKFCSEGKKPFFTGKLGVRRKKKLDSFEISKRRPRAPFSLREFSSNVKWFMRRLVSVI